MEHIITHNRILGLDYGDKTVGVAVSDPLLLTATPLETITRPNDISIKKTVARLSEIIKTYNIHTIVLGYPKNMDGSEGFRCAKTNDFKARLHRNFKRAEIILWDERLTTIQADRYLEALNRHKRGRVVDQAAACIILQGYLDYIKNQTNRELTNQEEVL
ncbi:MAG: Holliday junction resolvase RuvX [Defluviitaleaceae bacterium]|nr:Holliday junction resolvase RuvX [Defluviitaleaceae bacterium]